MRNRQRTVLGLALFVPVAAVLLSLFACLPAPVGDPEKSTVDAKLTGAWIGASEKSDDRWIALLRPWDRHTWYLVYLNTKKDGEGKGAGHMHFKAWLTRLGGATFITAEPLETLDYAFPPAAGEKAEKHWIVGRVDIKDDALTFRLIDLNSWIVKDLKTREKLEDAIKAQVDNKELYGDITTFQRITADKANLVNDALKLHGFMD
jgi:hypothetical protein